MSNKTTRNALTSTTTSVLKRLLIVTTELRTTYSPGSIWGNAEQEHTRENNEHDNNPLSLRSLRGNDYESVREHQSYGDEDAHIIRTRLLFKVSFFFSSVSAAANPSSGNSRL